MHCPLAILNLTIVIRSLLSPQTSYMGAVKQASLIHDQLIRNGFDSDVAIGNLLINMYATCGKLEESH